MKKHKIRDLFDESFGEYIFGSAETGRHGIYLVYGEASANEKREMGSSGHEEILLLLQGEAFLSDGEREISIGSEEAVYLGPDSAFTFTARGECRYVVAGGHDSPHGH